MRDDSIVLATSNPAKREQLSWLLSGLPLQPRGAQHVDVTEGASDLAANARTKALAHASDGLAIASDGGLEVPALAELWQPVLTRRQGQPRLGELTEGLTDRRVRWSEAVAIAYRGQLLASWTESGTEGMLAQQPWPPPTSFWVWDIFVFPELGKTWAQLTADERLAVDRTWTALKSDVQAFFQAFLPRV